MYDQLWRAADWTPDGDRQDPDLKRSAGRPARPNTAPPLTDCQRSASRPPDEPEPWTGFVEFGCRRFSCLCRWAGEITSVKSTVTRASPAGSSRVTTP